MTFLIQAKVFREAQFFSSSGIVCGKMAATNNKKPNTDILFSPEAPEPQPLVDKNYFKDLFSDILDEKFKEYFNPLKNQTDGLESNMETMKKHNEA